MDSSPNTESEKSPPTTSSPKTKPTTKQARLEKNRLATAKYRAKKKRQQKVKRYKVLTKEMKEAIHASVSTEARRKTIRLLLREKAYRRLMPVNMYDPIAKQLEFHKSNAPERLALGGNRAGKTTCCAMEVAWAVTGTHPYLPYPKENGRCMCVAKNIIKIGEVIYRKLFKRGAFDMVRDPETGLFRPWVPSIDGYEGIKRIPCIPPLDERMIKHVAWERKGLDCPKKVVLNNAWEITFWSSEGKPPNGVDVDLCLSGRSEIYDPVEKRLRRIDTIDGSFHVYSRNPDTGMIEVREATKPFIKGFGEIVRVKLSNGETLLTTRRHRLLAKSGRWVSVQEAFDHGIEVLDCGDWLRSHDPSALRTRSLLKRETSQQALVACASSTAAQQSPCRESETCFSRGHDGEQCHVHESESREMTALCGRSGMTLQTAPQLQAAPFVNTGLEDRWPSFREAERIQHAISSDQNTYEPEFLSSSGCTESYQDRLRDPSQSLSRSNSHTATEDHQSSSPTNPLLEIPSSCASVCVHADRQSQGSLGRCSGDCRPCDERARLVGALGQCVAPSHSGAPECGHSCTHRDSSACTDRCSRDRQHSDMQDADQASCDSRYTPLFIESVSPVGHEPIWDIGVNHTHNYLYESTVSHNCWFDEEVESQSWYDEMAARLPDRNGKFIWSATPQVGTDVLEKLWIRANEEKGKPNPRVASFHMIADDHDFISPEAKQIFKEKAAHDPDNYRVRVLGEFLSKSRKVYPEFNETDHVIDFFVPPPQWCRYLVVDPGLANSCALFFAVPPPSETEHAGHVFVYDELYTHGQNVREFTRLLEEKARSTTFQAFLIDAHGSRRGEVNGKTIGQQYAEQFKEFGIRSIETKHDFILMNNNAEKFGTKTVATQCSQVRSWLWKTPENPVPVLRIMNTCRVFIDELKFYKNKVVNGNTTNEPDGRQYSHGPDCLRYARMHELPYVAPASHNRLVGAFRRIMDKRKRQRTDDGNYVLLGSP